MTVSLFRTGFEMGKAEYSVYHTGYPPSLQAGAYTGAQCLGFSGDMSPAGWFDDYLLSRDIDPAPSLEDPNRVTAGFFIKHTGATYAAGSAEMPWLIGVSIDGESNLFGFWFDPETGTLKSVSAGTESSVNASSVGFVPDTWLFIGMDALFDATNPDETPYMRLYVNDTLALDVQGANANNRNRVTGLWAGGVRQPSGVTSYGWDATMLIDDAWWEAQKFNDAPVVPVPRRFFPIVPNSDGTTPTTDWTPEGTVSLYDAVDDTDSDGDTTHLHSSTIGEESQFGFVALAPVAGWELDKIFGGIVGRKTDQASTAYGSYLALGDYQIAHANRLSISTSYKLWNDTLSATAAQYDSDPARSGYGDIEDYINTLKLRLYVTG